MQLCHKRLGARQYTTVPSQWFALACLPAFDLQTTGHGLVGVGLLKSYEHMGYAMAVCEGGCSCEPDQWSTAHAAKVGALGHMRAVQLCSRVATGQR